MKIDLYNGDCLEVMDKLIAEGVKVDAVITDPPYELSGSTSGTTALSQRMAKTRNEIDFICNGYDYNRVFDLIINICKIPNIILFCSNKQLGKTVNYFESKDLKVDVLVWDKVNPSPLCYGKYVSNLEYIVYIHTNGSPWNNDAPFKFKSKTKRYPIVTSQTDNKVHPTQKPEGLMEELLLVHSFEGQLILDPFMGSGTTGVACNNLNRDFIGIEITEKYFDIAKSRIENMQGSLF